jgi:hypothetical protein
MKTENVAQFKHFGMTVTNPNLIREEIKKRLNSDNAHCHSVCKMLYFLLPKSVQIRMYKTIILPVVLYECKTRSLILGV